MTGLAVTAALTIWGWGFMISLGIELAKMGPEATGMHWLGWGCLAALALPATGLAYVAADRMLEALQSADPGQNADPGPRAREGSQAA